MILDLGLSLEDICSKVFGGILVFFPSYATMHQYHDLWMKNKITVNIKKDHGKNIHLESNDNSKFNDSLEDFKREIKEMKSKSQITGSLYLGVIRGKLSEGINLSDDSCRCVLIVGIPFQNITSEKIIFKRNFLECKKE